MVLVWLLACLVFCSGQAQALAADSAQSHNAADHAGEHDCCDSASSECGERSLPKQDGEQLATALHAALSGTLDFFPTASQPPQYLHSRADTTAADPPLHLLFCVFLD